MRARVACPHVARSLDGIRWPTGEGLEVIVRFCATPGAVLCARTGPQDGRDDEADEKQQRAHDVGSLRVGQWVRRLLLQRDRAHARVTRIGAVAHRVALVGRVPGRHAPAVVALVILQRCD